MSKRRGAPALPPLPRTRGHRCSAWKDRGRWKGFRTRNAQSAGCALLRLPTTGPSSLPPARGGPQAAPAQPGVGRGTGNRPPLLANSPPALAKGDCSPHVSSLQDTVLTALSPLPGVQLGSPPALCFPGEDSRDDPWACKQRPKVTTERLDKLSCAGGGAGAGFAPWGFLVPLGP